MEAFGHRLLLMLILLHLKKQKKVFYRNKKRYVVSNYLNKALISQRLVGFQAP